MMEDRQTTHRLRLKIHVWMEFEDKRAPLYRAKVIGVSDPKLEGFCDQTSGLCPSPTAAACSLLHLIYRSMDWQDLGWMVSEIEIGPKTAEKFVTLCGLSAVSEGEGR